MVVGKMLIWGPPLLKAFMPYTYDASRRAQAHQRKGYSAECVEGRFSELRIAHILGCCVYARFCTAGFLMYGVGGSKPCVHKILIIHAGRVMDLLVFRHEGFGSFDGSTISGYRCLSLILASCVVK